MRKKGLFDFIIRSGLFMQPIAMTVIVLAGWGETYLSSLALSFVPSLLIFLLFYCKNDEIKTDKEKPKASHPQVDKSLLRDSPQLGDFLLGTFHGKYVCHSLYDPGHIVIIGGSGSGKTSCHLIPTLLLNNLSSASPATAICAIDIKRELTQKTVKMGSEEKSKIRIFDPEDADAWGYDPYYRLSDSCTEQERFEVIESIVFSFIAKDAAQQKDAFWIDSCRNMLIGLLSFYQKQGFDFIAALDAILGTPIEQTLQTIFDFLDTNPDANTTERITLNAFRKMPDETLSGVYAQLTSNLSSIVTDEDIRRALGGSGKKINPNMLRQGCSIYFAISEYKLGAYAPLLHFIINQILEELERRPESEESPILIAVDELPRILSVGPMASLLDGARILRSHHTTLCLISQSVPALMAAYTEPQVEDLLANCSYRIILDVSDNKTATLVSSWTGKYKEEKRSRTTGGKQKSNTLAYEDKDLVSSADLMKLRLSNELILISPYGYNRLDKCPYYEDSYFAPLADDVRIHNQTIKELTDSVEERN